MSDSSQLTEREERLNAVLAEYLDAQRLGRAPSRDELLAQHPDFVEDLVAFLEDQAALARFSPAAPAPAFAETVSLPPAGNAAGDTLPEPAPGSRVRYFGDYELLEEIARGGMGVVFKARQVSLNRIVALKMILAGQFASEGEVRRFRAEAESAANLDHPNIVPIYEVGEHQGHQYFSMKLVEGGHLAQAIAQGAMRNPESQKRTVRLLTLVARAVHFAHQRGILHRDLKPANVLLDRDGSPYVTDFGLAKSVEGRSHLTQTGAVMGTPSYMAPEQAVGAKELTTAIDIYSLGAILYEVLTGMPPFKAGNVYETLRQVREQEPARPRSVNLGADRDLETICLKCLQQEPAKRDESAAALADDLERWLDDRPILARPIGTGERVVKWAKRRPAVAALAAAVVLVAATGFAGVVWKWRDAVAAEQTAEIKAKDALDALGKADHALKEEARATAVARKAEADEKKARDEAENRRIEADDLRKQAEKDREAIQVTLKRADGLRLTAEPEIARPFEPGLAVLLAVEGVKRAPGRIAFTTLHAAMRDSREERVLGGDGRYDRGWNVFYGKAADVRVFPDGKRFLAAVGSSFRVYDRETGQMLAEWKGFNQPIRSASLSPDGKRVVVTVSGHAAIRHSDGKTYQYTDRLVYVVDLEKGEEALRLRDARDSVTYADFNRDSTRIVTASDDGKARIYEAATGKLLHTLDGHTCSLLTARFTANGKQVVTVSSNVRRSSYGFDHVTSGGDKAEIDPPIDPKARPQGGSGSGGGSFSGEPDQALARCWDAETGKEIDVLTPAAALTQRSGRPKDVALSAAGMLAIAIDTKVVLWQPKGPPPVVHGLGSVGVTSLAFNPSGELLAIGLIDRTIQLRNVKEQRDTLRLRGPQAPVRGVCFDTTGKRILGWADDSVMRVWLTETGEEVAVLRGHREHPEA